MSKKLKFILGAVLAFSLFTGCSNSDRNTSSIFKPSVQKPQHVKGKYELDYTFFKKIIFLFQITIREMLLNIF